MKKKVLILSTLDERGRGHGWSYIELFQKLGLDTDFICLLRRYTDTKKYIIDTINPYNLHYLYYKFMCFAGKVLFAPFKNMRWMYKGGDFASSKDIIERLDANPDYILITSYHRFLSPKSIYELWKHTGATIILLMVDEKILGGGCPYPLNCKGYEHGCTDCALYPYAKFIPRNIFRQKEKFFSQIPFHLVGTGYDLQKASHVSYLRGKETHRTVGVPEIPFSKSKKEARIRFGLTDNAFVIMAGAVNVSNPAKGFTELMDSLNIFAEQVSSKRKVVLLLLGRIVPELKLSDKIELCQPGFLDLEGLFTAYYACDVYVSPSIEDSGPFMVNYAIACGRPVIAFPVGVALDLVIPKKTGWIAKLRDTKEYADGIKFFYDMNGEDFSLIEDNCKKHIESFREKRWYQFMIK